MRGGVILIAIALVIAYLGVTGRYKCWGLFFNCMINPEGCACGGASITGEGGGPIIVTPGGNSGVNPTNAPIYDARNFLPPIEAFV